MHRGQRSVSSGSSHTLMADITKDDIQSWTLNAIVMRKDDICTSEVFTIDLNANPRLAAGAIESIKTKHIAKRTRWEENLELPTCQGFRC